jgi:hypothetical protein
MEDGEDVTKRSWSWSSAIEMKNRRMGFFFNFCLLPTSR